MAEKERQDLGTEGTALLEQQTPEQQAESEQELSRKIEEALACPCIDDIKAGPCGASFIGAFSCFIRSQSRGAEVDCLDQFNAMQQCMGKHPEAFADVMQSIEGALEHRPAPQ